MAYTPYQYNIDPEYDPQLYDPRYALGIPQAPVQPPDPYMQPQATPMPVPQRQQTAPSASMEDVGMADEDKAIKNAQQNAFIASLVNLGATIGAALSPGGPGAARYAYDPNASQRAYQGSMDEYKVRDNKLRQLAELRLKRQQEERQGGLQELAERRAAAAEGRAVRKEGREETAFRQEQETRDPNSPTNANWRKGVMAAYPEVVEKIGEDAFSRLTINDARSGTILPKIFDDARREREMRLGSELRQTEYDRRQAAELKKAALTGRGLGEAREALGEAQRMTPTGAFGYKPEAIRTVLRAEFPEGWLEEHPQIEAAVKTIERGGFSRGSENATLKAELSDLAKRAAEETEKGAKQYVDELKQAGVLRIWSAVSSFKQEIDKAKAKHGGDIPGVGGTNFLSSLLGGGSALALSQEGKNVQRAVERLRDEILRIATGANAPVHEQEQFKKILGTTAWSTDQDLMNGVDQIMNVLRAKDDDIAAGMPDSAVRWYERKKGARGWRNPIDWGGSGGTSGINAPTTGPNTSSTPGTLGGGWRTAP